MKKLSIILGAAVLFLIALFIISLISSVPVWLLWNALMPTLFGLTKITWLQAWGLLVLCGFLFKSNCSSSKSKD